MLQWYVFVLKLNIVMFRLVFVICYNHIVWNWLLHSFFVFSFFYLWILYGWLLIVSMGGQRW